jgi:uncharacterized membrane protein
MKKAHLVFSVLTILLGAAHVGFTPVFYRQFDLGAMWFVGTGLATVFLGVANVFLAGRSEPAMRLLGAAMNLVGLGFISTLAVMLKAPQGYLGVGFALGMLVCGLRSGKA